MLSIPNETTKIGPSYFIQTKPTQSYNPKCPGPTPITTNSPPTHGNDAAIHLSKLPTIENYGNDEVEDRQSNH